MDAGLVAKSATKTFGLGTFYHGRKGKAERGLEISELALMDTVSRQAFSLSCQQSVAETAKSRPERYAPHGENCRASLPEGVRHLLVGLLHEKERHWSRVQPWA